MKKIEANESAAQSAEIVTENLSQLQLLLLRWYVTDALQLRLANSFGQTIKKAGDC